MKTQLLILFLYAISLLPSICDTSELESGSGEGIEFHPVAALYDVMSNRLEALDDRIKVLEAQAAKVKPGNTAMPDLHQFGAEIKRVVLDAVEMRISELKKEFTSLTCECVAKIMNQTTIAYTVPVTTPRPKPDVYRNCLHVSQLGGRSGLYKIYLTKDTTSPIRQVYCEIEEDSGQAYLVIQRRVNGSVSFYRGWTDYKAGFGDLDSNFWIGNDVLHLLTEGASYMLRVEMRDQLDKAAFAEYNHFRVLGEKDQYRLEVSGYHGTAGDALRTANGRRFSTFDRDMDGSILYNCARLHKGAFWYDKCGSANPNGIYQPEKRQYSWQNIIWYTWKKDLRPLSYVVMKIREVEYPMK